MTMSIARKITHYQEVLAPFGSRLIAVSKTKPNENLLEAYEAGQRDFGENKVQELVDKAESLPRDINWHMIGHLQRNKVKYIAPFVSLIHPVDSARLAAEINKQALKNNRTINCLLQVHIADEATKFGFDAQELPGFLESEAFGQMENIRIIGLMGMATHSPDQKKIRQEFRSLKNLSNLIAEKIDSPKVSMSELSMGMTSDYQIACEEGSTMVRIGSAIFGARNHVI